MTMKKILMIAGGALLTLVLVVIMSTRTSSTKDILVDQALSAPSGETSSESVKPQAQTLVEISDPFQLEDRIAVSYTTSVDDSNPTFASLNRYDVYSDTLILPAPSSFEDQGLGLTTLNEGGNVVVVFQYTFHQPATVTWDEGSAIGNTNSWKSHPDTVQMTAGSKAVVTFTKNNETGYWEAEFRS